MAETLTDGEYWIWMCDECTNHCIYTREPKKGEQGFQCDGNGRTILLTAPPKEV